MSDDAARATPPAGRGKPNWRKWLGWILRIGGTAGGFAYIASVIDLASVGDALTRVQWWAFAGASVVSVANLFVGAFRWRVLLAAYGAPRRPSIPYLARVYWVGFFYNNFLPGGVGGDVVRGVVTRQSFGERGATASVTVVLVERALGLSGLLLLVSATSVIAPLPGTEGVLPYSALGLVLAGLGVTSVAVGRRLAPYLPGRLATFAGSLPTIESWGPFFGALAISLVTQAGVAVTGWFLLYSASGGTVTLSEAFVVVPLAMAATYFPLTVGGAGAREMAFMELGHAALGLDESAAVAAALLIWFTQLAVSAVGGVLQLVWPVTGNAAPEDAGTDDAATLGAEDGEERVETPSS